VSDPNKLHKLFVDAKPYETEKFKTLVRTQATNLNGHAAMNRELIAKAKGQQWT
jgi:hypothetical protein